MPLRAFVGRKQELGQLKVLHEKRIPSLVVVKGRRRIGKSCLIAEFASKNPQNRLWNFTGLAPVDGISAQNQRDYFGRQLSFNTQYSSSDVPRLERCI